MTQDLPQRIAVTVGALLIYRLGQYIPLPGIDAEAWAIIFHGHGSGVARAVGALSGGVRRISILALGILPYISAAVLVQLATIVSRRLRALSREGERGRRAMVQYARYLTVLLTAFQAWGIASAIEQVDGVVANPGPLFVLSTVVTGEATAARLDHIVSRTTVVGAVYLALICLLPDVLLFHAPVPFYFGGVELLVAVCTILDLVVQFRTERRS